MPRSRVFHKVRVDKPSPAFHQLPSAPDQAGDRLEGHGLSQAQGSGGDGELRWAEVGVGATWEALVTTGLTHASSRAPCQGCSMSVICWETSARRQLTMAVRSKVWGIGGCLCQEFRESEQEKMNNLGRQKRKTPVWVAVCLKPWEGAWQDSISKRRLWPPQSRRVSRPWSTQYGTWGIGWFCISVRILACSLHFSFMPLLSPVVIAF